MINTVGDLRNLLKRFYDNQPISTIAEDTGEIYQLTSVDVNEESEVEIRIG